MSGTIPQKIFLYRFTHIDNIKWTLENGIVAINSPAKCLNYKGIGDKKIINKRAVTDVPITPNGVLNDYVPFYFASRSPMLYFLTKNDLALPQNIIYIVSTIEKLQKYDHKFIFTDGHALIAISKFYNHIDKLNEVDWNVMQERYWNNTIQDNDRQRRREAELLVKDLVLPQAILGLAMYNSKHVDYIKGLVKTSGLNVSVVVRPTWYY